MLFTPALVASIYGMNVDDMSELHWAWGYPFALTLMLGLGIGLWGRSSSTGAGPDLPADRPVG